jgi:acetate kinase
MCCIQDGKSVDTSMGVTPLEGLVMGTRCGDIDAGLLPYLSGMGMSMDEIDHLLNKKSGLLGLSGHADLRAVQEAAAAGDRKCSQAVQVWPAVYLQHHAWLLCCPDRLI